MHYISLPNFTTKSQTSQSKWRVIGEEAVKVLSNYATLNEWTFQNKYLLLQAELHYLNQDLDSAENAFKASIESAISHKMTHELALATELFGIFYIENNWKDKGLDQLRVALKKYEEWGAVSKVLDIEQYILTLIDHPS